MSYKKWDIILVPFPFTNLATSKKRPSLIISPNEYNVENDVVIVFITSKLDSKYRLGDYKIRDWVKSNFPKPSMLRMKFATINIDVIIKKLGKLSENDKKGFSELLADFFKR